MRQLPKSTKMIWIRLSAALSEPQGSCRSASSIDVNQGARQPASDNLRLSVTTGEKAMIRPTVVALALCVVSSAQSMPYVPLQQPNNSVIPVRQGCGLGRQLVDGICVSNPKVRAAVRKCSARKMRMVNGRCEPRVRPAAAPAAGQPPAAPAAARPAAAPATTQQPPATPATAR